MTGPKAEKMMWLTGIESGKMRIYPDKRGFTLLEMLLVVTIMMILFAVSTPMLSRTARELYFQSRVKKTAALFRHLRKSAVEEEQEYKLIVDLKKKRYDLFVNEDSGFREFRGSLLRGDSFPETFSLSSSGAGIETVEFCFYPDGSLNSSGLEIADTNNRRARLTTTLSGEVIVDYIQ